jgi:hypothetical protein
MYSYFKPLSFAFVNMQADTGFGAQRTNEKQ